jgi:hypothetical protein
MNDKETLKQSLCELVDEYWNRLHLKKSRINIHIDNSKYFSYNFDHLSLSDEYDGQGVIDDTGV